MALNANQMTTGRVRLSYEHLMQPYSGAMGGEPKYSVTILLPKSDAETKARLDAAYRAAVNAGVAAKWNGVMPPMIACPIYDGDGVKQNGEPFGDECKGHWVFTASNKNAVPLCDINMNPIVNPSEIYSGIYARVCLSFYAYSQAGKRGIACGLEAVQKLDDGEPLAGRISIADAFGGANAVAAPPMPQGYPQQGYAAPVQPQPQQGYAAPVQPQYGAVDPITGAPL